MGVSGGFSSYVFGEFCLSITASIIVWISFFISWALLQFAFLLDVKEYAYMPDKCVLLLYVSVVVCWWQKIGRSVYLGAQKENTNILCKLMGTCASICKSHWESGAKNGNMVEMFFWLIFLGARNVLWLHWGRQIVPKFRRWRALPETALCTQWMSMFPCSYICLPGAPLMWGRERAGEDIVWLWLASRGSTLCTSYTWHTSEVWAGVLLHRDEGSGIGVATAALLSSSFLLATLALIHLRICVNYPVHFKRLSLLFLLLQLP